MKYPNIKRLQEAHRLTDADMGKIIGKTAKTYARMLSGASSFRCSDMVAICHYFHVSADYAFAKGDNNA